MIPLILVVLLTLCSLKFKKSKILFASLFVLMWVLFGWNYFNADYPMYKNMYSIPTSELDFFSYEGGYKFLIFCCKSIGLNFHQFYVLVSALLLLLVFRFFYIFSCLPAFLTVCFFWFFFPLQFVLLRNFLAFSIILQGLIPVFRNENYSKIKYVFFVLLASTIHISSLFYLVFLIGFRTSEIKIKTISLWVLGVLLVLFLSHNYIFSFLSLIHEEKTLFYRTSLTLFLAYSFIQILNLFVINYFLKLDNRLGEEENARANTIVLNINILMLFLIPVYYEMAVFVRILLNFSIVNIVFITNKSFIADNKVFPKILFLAYLFFWFFGFIYFVRETTIVPLFFKNLLFR